MKSSCRLQGRNQASFMYLLYLLLPVLLLLIIYFRYPNLLYGVALWFERFRAGWQEQVVAIENRPVYYLDSGLTQSKDGSTLLFVHGFAGDRDNWDRLAAHLPRSYRRVALDLPGFGASPLDRPEEAVLSAQVERLRAFMDQLKLDRVHLFGCSMGGHLSVHFAVKYPQRVRSLILFDPAGIEQGRNSEHFRMLAQGTNCLAPSDLQQYDRMLDMLFTKRPFIPAPLKRYLGEKAIDHSAFFLKAWQVVFHDRYEPLEPVLPALAASKIPVQIYWGRQDRIIAFESVSVFQSALPEAEIHVYENCGHLPFLEHPRRTAKLIVSFLLRIDAS
jgi:pimeloyl-ACP methyl ester carboxylesterase